MKQYHSTIHASVGWYGLQNGFGLPARDWVAGCGSSGGLGGGRQGDRRGIIYRCVGVGVGVCLPGAPGLCCSRSESAHARRLLAAALSSLVPQEVTWALRRDHPAAILTAEITPEDPQLMAAYGFDAIWVHSG